MRKGKIIALEGPDKAGKMTQSKLLVDSLRKSGRISVVMDFPDYSTPIGMEISAFLEDKRDYSNEVKHMLMSANRWERKREIESLVKTGTIVVINRYYQSNLVYGISNGLNIDWLLNLDKGLPKEDIAIVINISPSTVKLRTEKLDLFERSEKLLLAVNKNYSKLAKRFSWKIMSGDNSKEQVHQDILNLLKREKII
ncbi:dTMP kinase [Nitrososphaera sp. AFS]|uniref:dTMP kinase n=1 Tax=Nitrososphaera sp. AFS TaxID=2301191 RepID=UPI0013923DC7|nr:dTMP kinase [Nitrososphaera sp. AFS]NAL77343.1 dTMP kinase [Nitrososphaera sp. AFS]